MASQSASHGVVLPDRIVPMRVIVCGVHRTGTLSIRSALRELGFHDCYHMHSMIDNLSDAPEWVRAFEAKYAGKGTFTRADWDRLLGDCQAVCDAPAAFFGAELAVAYPEAKVVILNRDPEQWYDSVLNSIYTMTKPKSLARKLKMMYCLIFDKNVGYMFAYSKSVRANVLQYDHGLEKEKALAWYNAQYAEFRERIPADRCLEYTIQEGWEPLCDFLDVPVPTVKNEATGEAVESPFPRLNDRAAFQGQSAKILARSTARANSNLMSALGRLALTGVVGYAGYLAWRTRLGGRP
ncbi:P-loop containing nucleoside triphosphate hydrolase protein [Ilyonectria robusta]|uniref:P-loop containing nucleoside triphosphate hydrolase protein n=1 Tax=Ilyonectria robusta TaxID=1079257 RepID=UPI001E8D0C34|nr:P-loop containing nucleoside triphosphate hydrolase protein [Ilyonectria robusta]KAH8736384.1 P-loop containing nucleoside triphosphate hydrolase protein [Ilyonectria robusta]